MLNHHSNCHLKKWILGKKTPATFLLRSWESFWDQAGGEVVIFPVTTFPSRADMMMSFLVDVNSLVHVESYEARLVQLLPQSHFHAQVVVDVEAHRVVGAVVVVVRVVLIVWGHEAVRAHLQ